MAEFSAAQLDGEADRLGGVILDHMLEGTARVMRVGDRIRIAGAPYCGGQVGAVLGIFTASKDTLLKLVEPDLEFENRMQRAALARFPLDDRERILIVVPGLPADKAGLRPGDVVTRVSGHEAGRRDHLQALHVDSGGAPLTLTVERDGRELDVPVETQLGCSYPAQSWFGNDINAFAGHMGNRSGSYVLGGMLEFLPSDDDLAIVLGHELGHLILYSGGTKRTEADADYVGLYVAARAGFEVTRAPDLWERMGRANPYSNIQWGFFSHPSSAQRSTALRAALAEIAAKQAAGTPLDPAPVTERDEPAASDEGTEESTEMRAGALEQLQQKRERLLRVSHALRTRAVQLCGDKAAPVLGAALARRRDALFGKEAEAAEIFGLVDEVKVLAVIPDSPAASAGVTPGDLVLEVDGEKISRTEEVYTALRAERDQPPKLVLLRSGARVEATLPRLLGCPQEFMLVVNGSYDPWANRDGEDIWVPEGLLRFARDDDELAIALAHQIAHQQLGSALLTSFADEPPADVLGLHIATRAGFDVSKAPALLDRMVAEEPLKLDPKSEYRGLVTLHGGAVQRSLTVRRELAAMQPSATGADARTVRPSD
ncbi:MAG: PDZ domain-containing protein [Myxococcota bacterium]